MDVMITSKIDQTFPITGRYVTVEVSAGSHSAVVLIADDYVRVIVSNASHRAFRRMGKQFRNAEEARANYKTPEIRAIIDAAVAERAAA